MTGHPHDPFKRLDVLPSDRHVRGVLRRADAGRHDRRAVAVYESHIPVRWYVPPDDVRLDLLTPSDSTSLCAYKGAATYFSVADDPGGEGADVAWTYVDPLHEVARSRTTCASTAERTDLSVDGVDVPRPGRSWSSPEDQETI